MEYHSIKIQLITRKGKLSTKEQLQTYNLTEAIIWLESKKLEKGK